MSSRPRNFKCALCGHAFGANRDLVNHLNRRTPCVPAVVTAESGVPWCCHCGKQLSRSDSVARHKKKCKRALAAQAAHSPTSETTAKAVQVPGSQPVTLEPSNVPVFGSSAMDGKLSPELSAQISIAAAVLDGITELKSGVRELQNDVYRLAAASMPTA